MKTAATVAALVVLTAVASWWWMGQRSEQPLHVLLITLDTTRADALGSYGNDAIETPNIDSLADRGVQYDSAFTTVPITLPAHTSMMTGSYPIYHGVRENAGYYVPAELDTLAEILNAQGYDTAAFVGAFPLDSQTRIDQGFDLYDDNFASASPLHPRLRRFYDERPAADVARGAIAWLDDREEKPFFLWTHFFDPHHPLLPPSRYRDVYPQAPYFAEIASVDEALGQIFKRLHDNGQLDRTLIILTADHGEGMGEHGEQTHALLLYSSTLRVPLIVADPTEPTTSQERRIVRAPVSNLDIFATVLDRLGLPLPDQNQGFPLPLTDQYADPQRQIYSETLFGRLLYGWSPLHRLTAGDQVLLAGPSERMFDRSTDPDEVADLSEVQPQRLQRMRSDLADNRRDLAQGGHEFASAPVTAETIQRLAALGYVGVGPVDTELSDEVDPSRADPLAMMEVFDLYNEAQTVGEEGMHEWSIALYRRALKLNPSNPGVRLAMAHSLLAAGYTDESFEQLKALLADDPSHVPAHLMLAQHHLQRSEVNEALQLIQNAAELDSADLSTQLMLAHLHEDTGDNAEAQQTYLRILEQDSEHLVALNGLATLDYRAGDVDMAVARFNQVVDLQPYYPPAYLNLGVVEFDRGNFARALDLARQAKLLQPGYENAVALAKRAEEALQRDGKSPDS